MRTSSNKRSMSRQKMSLPDIPVDVLYRLAKKMDYYTLKQFCSTNKRMAELCRINPSFRKLMETKYAAMKYTALMSVPIIDAKSDDPEIFNFIVVFRNEDEYDMYRGDGFDNVPIEELLSRYRPGYEATDLPEVDDSGLPGNPYLMNYPVIDMR